MKENKEIIWESFALFHVLGWQIFSNLVYEGTERDVLDFYFES